ncbi:hypothetical protein EKD04_001635 [Chloroflexales bacterium ZM16-3]|nr:hypothetical protein [Chloroflexales bacterium ZM16-3]
MPRRPDSSTIAADRAALRAIEELIDYQPVNQAYSTPMLQQMEATLNAAEEATEQARIAYERAQRAYAQARLVENETGKGFHGLILSAKTHVLAQYGDDSYAVQAIGWTRRSDRKRPVRKVAAA